VVEGWSWGCGGVFGEYVPWLDSELFLEIPGSVEAGYRLQLSYQRTLDPRMSNNPPSGYHNRGLRTQRNSRRTKPKVFEIAE
jgi:hypothetical protein